MIPLDVPTRETVEFLRSHLASGATLLEVGCGAGFVAGELARLGYRVVAVDSSQESVSKARARGVAAIEVTWPDYDAELVDAIAFTRSLHHIGALDPAIDRARRLLATDGVLLVEDFTRETPDRRLLDWFAGALRSPEARSLISLNDGELVTAMLERDPIEAWVARHDREDLHGTEAMTEAVRRHFLRVESFGAPYLYRYLVPVLPETAEAARFVERVLEGEREFCQRVAVEMVGRRIVASGKDAEPR